MIKQKQNNRQFSALRWLIITAPVTYVYIASVSMSVHSQACPTMLLASV